MTPPGARTTLARLLICSATLTGAAGSALAQFGEPFTPPEVRTPVPQTWLFERPLMPVVILVVLGLAALYTLRRSGKPRHGLLALLGALAASGAMLLTAAMVTTTRERVTTTCQRIIEAVASNDTDTASGLMGPTVSLRMSFGATADSREALLAQIRRLHTEATVRGADVLETRVELRSPTLARAYVKVRVEGSVGGFPIPPTSWWELNLAGEGQGSAQTWELIAIEPLWIVGIDNPAGR